MYLERKEVFQLCKNLNYRIDDFTLASLLRCGIRIKKIRKDARGKYNKEDVKEFFKSILETRHITKARQF